MQGRVTSLAMLVVQMYETGTFGRGVQHVRPLTGEVTHRPPLGDPPRQTPPAVAVHRDGWRRGHNKTPVFSVHGCSGSHGAGPGRPRRPLAPGEGAGVGFRRHIYTGARRAAHRGSPHPLVVKGPAPGRSVLPPSIVEGGVRGTRVPPSL